MSPARNGIPRESSGPLLQTAYDRGRQTLRQQDLPSAGSFGTLRDSAWWTELRRVLLHHLGQVLARMIRCGEVQRNLSNLHHRDNAAGEYAGTLVVLDKTRLDANEGSIAPFERGCR